MMRERRANRKKVNSRMTKGGISMAGISQKLGMVT
jgi:hypothetical protein